MVPAKTKSRTFRRVFVRTPGAKNKVHFRLAKPGPARCAVSGEKLAGVPRLRPLQLKKVPKSQRRPNRPFGGVLGSKAMRSFFVNKAKEL